MIFIARISKYEEWVNNNEIKDKLVLVEGWSRDGLTQKQIADNLGINVDTLIEYKKKYPDFSEALKKGKEVVDIEVENALLKRALGYKYDEVTEVDEYGFAGIKKGGKWGVINSNGDVILEPTYESDELSPIFIGKYCLKNGVARDSI